jgi:hypothetical protein
MDTGGLNQGVLHKNILVVLHLVGLMSRPLKAEITRIALHQGKAKSPVLIMMVGQPTARHQTWRLAVAPQEYNFRIRKSNNMSIPSSKRIVAINFAAISC